MGKVTFAVVLILLLIGMLAPAIDVGEVSSESAIIRVPDDYATIQEAVDAANSSDIIQVSAGIYYEHVKVKKSNLTLIGVGREGSSRTIVDGEDFGVVLHLHDGKYAKVVGFTFRNGDKGIQLNEAHGAVLTNNTVTNNNGGGIWVVDSNSVKMRNNIMQNNYLNFGVETIHEENISCYIHDIDTSNKVNGKAIYYMLNQKGRSIDSTTFHDLGYLALVNSNNITIKNLDIQDVTQAILLANTSDSVIENVTSPCGIYLWGSKHNSIRKNNFSCGAGGITMKENSDNNIVCDNLVSNNSIVGIEVLYSSNNEFISNMILWNGLWGVTVYFRPQASGNLFIGNTILGSDDGIIDFGDNNIFYHNNFIDNGRHVSCTYPNIWDNGYPSGGNFWSNYNGTDLCSGPHQNETGADGIGDTPYIMNDDNRDNYPLMQPYNGPVRNLDTGLSHPTIQEALNNADSGHRIFVPSGIYCEHVVINKSLTLLGQARSTTFLDGYSEGTVLSILTNNVSIYNFTVRNGFNGVSLESVSNCTIASNTITSNKAYAINAVGSHITITENVVARNMKGINGTLNNSQVYNNTFFHNNFIYDSYQGYTRYFFNNTWDNDCEGNYWSNYNGSDLDGDGIGDTYLPWEGVDHFPLMNPYWNPADINHDLKVDIYDVVLACSAYGSTPLDANWNPHCDIAELYGIIDIYDVVMMAGSYGEEYTP